MRVQYPPDAEHAPDHAALAVSVAEEVDGVRLDYSLGSLTWVDGLLGGFSEPGSDATAETIYAMGCYVGEVLVRGYGYRWGSNPGTQTLGFPVTVIGPTGDVLNPVGKAFKRVDNGPEDSVAYFVHALARPAAPPQ